MLKFSENKMPGLLFADDFVQLAKSRQALTKLVRYCTYRPIIIVNIGILKTTLKCTVVLSKLGNHSGTWVWGHESLPVLDSYCYLGIELSSNGSLDNIKLLIIHNKQKFGGLCQVLHNFASGLKLTDTFSWLCCDLVWNMAMRCGILINVRLKI